MTDPPPWDDLDWRRKLIAQRLLDDYPTASLADVWDELIVIDEAIRDRQAARRQALRDDPNGFGYWEGDLDAPPRAPARGEPGTA